MQHVQLNIFKQLQAIQQLELSAVSFYKLLATEEGKNNNVLGLPTLNIGYGREKEKFFKPLQPLLTE